jgi:DNA polymerase I-like protein with 3'-5' exonuclease and polymerase domains
LSGDQALMSAYNDGDIYHALAKMCGLTKDNDRIRWKNTSPAERQRMKALQLGISYGMGVPSLAKGLDRHPLIASTIIEKHKRQYARFWEWRADQVTSAMLERQLDSFWLAAVSEHQPERAHTLQLSDAVKRRRDAAAGGLAHV